MMLLYTGQPTVEQELAIRLLESRAKDMLGLVLKVKSNPNTDLRDQPERSPHPPKGRTK